MQESFEVWTLQLRSQKKFWQEHHRVILFTDLTNYNSLRGGNNAWLFIIDPWKGGELSNKIFHKNDWKHLGSQWGHINANLLTKEMVIWSKLKCNIYLYNTHRGISCLLKKEKSGWETLNLSSLLKNVSITIPTYHYQRETKIGKREERENNGIFLSPIVTNEYLVRNQWLKTDGSYVLTCCWYSLQKICTKSVVVVMLMKCLMMDDLPFTYLLALSLPPSSPLSIRCIEEVLHTVGFYTFSNSTYLYFFATR